MSNQGSGQNNEDERSPSGQGSSRTTESNNSTESPASRTDFGDLLRYALGYPTFKPVARTLNQHGDIDGLSHDPARGFTQARPQQAATTTTTKTRDDKSSASKSTGNGKKPAATTKASSTSPKGTKGDNDNSDSDSGSGKKPKHVVCWR